MTSDNLPVIRKIGVIGAGNWGTALADLLASKGLFVKIWGYEEEVVASINEKHENPLYLKNFKLSPNLKATSSLEEIAFQSEMLLSVVPSHFTREVLRKIVPYLSKAPYFVSATKGIEEDSLKMMHSVAEEILPKEVFNNYAAISGPSFANEVIRRMPTAVTGAAYLPQVQRVVQETFGAPYFRIYSSSDVAGVEVGGAIKNVIALAAGISDGLGFGHSTRAALITRGLAEISRLGTKIGANPFTLSGLSGMGDLILTATGDLSRNRTVGLRLGRGEKLEEILKDMRMVAEGVRTSYAVYKLSKTLDVEMPISEKVYRILYEGLEPKEAVMVLMGRSPKAEI